MVACPRTGAVGPAIHVDMFCFNPTQGNSRRDEDVVKLFVKVVENVRVSLSCGYLGEIVNLEKNAVECFEDRASLYVLVPVTCDYNVRKGVQLQEGLDESLGEVEVQ